MFTYRNVCAAVAGMAMTGATLVGPASPANAAPADDGHTATATTATTWAAPVDGTSATIEFTDAATTARAASLSPYLAEIVREAKRVRTVDIQTETLDSPLAAESVAIELFGNTSIALDTNVALSPGARSSSTYSAGGKNSAAILTLIGEDLHGAIWKGTTKYGIEPLGGGRHLIYEEGRTFPDEGEPVAADGDATGAPSPAASAEFGTLATSVIDIMVAYDQAAVAIFGSAAAAEAEIVDMVNTTNMTFANSLIDAELVLTSTPALSYTPNATDGTNDDDVYLGAIRNKTDGILDDLHTERDASEADLIAVISDMSEYCGLAYRPTSSNGAEASAFSLTDGACSDLTFTHEVGHNLCAHHDPDNAGGTPCAPDAFAHYSSADALRTVMAYVNPCGSCTRIPYFSNPNVAYNGWTTGILGSRDNARVVGVTAPDVAGYRPVPPPCEVDYVISGGWPGNVQVDLVVENTSNSWINTWTAEWTFTGDESVYNSWGVVISQVGPEATATSDGFGGSIAPGNTVTVGFQATVTGTPTVPGPISCNV